MEGKSLVSRVKEDFMEGFNSARQYGFLDYSDYLEELSGFRGFVRESGAVTAGYFCLDIFYNKQN